MVNRWAKGIVGQRMLEERRVRESSAGTEKAGKESRAEKRYQSTWPSIDKIYELILV